MVGEIAAGYTGFTFLLNSVRALKDMNDAAIRNAAVIELQGQILAAQEAQSTLVAKVRELEETIRGFETWSSEKKRYELKSVGSGTFAYMLKPEERGTEPPHWLCQPCYEQGYKSLLQKAPSQMPLFMCGKCKAAIPERNGPKWLPIVVP